MLVSHAFLTWLGKAGLPIVWVGLPPGSGHSGLTAGGGRAIDWLTSAGSGSTLRSSPSTEIRSPGSLVFSFSPNRSQAAVVAEASNTETKRRRCIFCGGRKSGSQYRRHFGSASARAFRRGKIVSKLFVDVERAGFVAALEPSRRGQFKGSRPPWAAGIGKRLQAVDNRLGI